MPSFKPDKLRVNLRLSINRLKLLEKKKSQFSIVLCRKLWLPLLVLCYCSGNFDVGRVPVGLLVPCFMGSTEVWDFLSPAEEAMKARREIADYIKNKRTERARIRVCQEWENERMKRFNILPPEMVQSLLHVVSSKLCAGWFSGAWNGVAVLWWFTWFEQLRRSAEIYMICWLGLCCSVSPLIKKQ